MLDKKRWWSLLHAACFFNHESTKSMKINESKKEENIGESKLEGSVPNISCQFCTFFDGINSLRGWCKNQYGYGRTCNPSRVFKKNIYASYFNVAES